MRILFIYILVFGFLPSNGQKKQNAATLKMARKELSDFRYAYAIPFFKSYLKQVPNDTIALSQLAICYKNVNQYDSAILYLDRAVQMGSTLNSMLPELYASVGQYDKAVDLYKKIIEVNDSVLYVSRLSGFKNINKFFADSLDFNIFNTKLNTSYNEYNATLYKSGLLFESNRITKKKRLKKPKQITEFAWDGASFTKLYFYPTLDSLRTDTITSSFWKEKQVIANYSEYSRESPNDTRTIPSSYGYNLSVFNANGVESFDEFISNKLNVGAVCFTENGLKAYYTRNQKKSKGIYQLEIWEARNINGKWVNHHKMFFNNPNYSCFHPAITPDGKRLFYASDDPSGFGGTDLYYIDQNNDGSWKSTTNLGMEINTAGNELFPSFYEGSFFFSSNGHPGMGGLDIYRLVQGKRGEVIVKNMGYPINSSKDDLAFIIKESKGFFSTNRYGSDDILAYDFQKEYINIAGKVTLDNKITANRFVYLYQKNELGVNVIVDSARLDASSNYSFKVRPNKEYELITYDDMGKTYSTPITADGYTKLGDSYKKEVTLIDMPLSATAKADAIITAQKIKDAEISKMTVGFKRTIDSLKQLTSDYVELHHPFDQVFIIQKDLNDYYKIIQRVKGLHKKKIIIVSAADCNGSLEYNEDLSTRRAKRIFKTLSNLSNNNVVIKNVGERELLKACDDLWKDKDEQLVNRYSYIFILNN